MRRLAVCICIAAAMGCGDAAAESGTEAETSDPGPTTSVGTGSGPGTSADSAGPSGGPSSGPGTSDGTSETSVGETSDDTTEGPSSGVIVDVVFDMTTLRNETPGNGLTCRGCDNWPITETASGMQFTSWGDGDGFEGGSRASMGVARIEGGKDDYSAFDLFKTGSDSGGFDGKSYGLIAIEDTLFMWRSGNGSDAAGYALEELYRSDDGVDWALTGATWYPNDFSNGRGFSNLTFCQYGPGYAGGGDFVYAYGFEEEAGDWNVQFPGRVSLMRAPVDALGDGAQYEYFAGLDGGAPTWTADLEQRVAVFEDAEDGAMRLSVVYRAPIDRYVMMMQQVDRNFPDARLGIYQAGEPWGPFTDALPENPADPKTLGAPIPIIADGNGDEADAEKTVFFGISNKWSDEMDDAEGFVMVYTGDWQDEWGSVEGHFVLAE